MKGILTLLLMTILSRSAWSAAVEKFDYVGEAKLSSADGRSLGSQAFLLEKTHDPGNSLIVERAVVVTPDRGVDEYTMNLKVQGNSFVIDDTQGTIHGTGTLFGPAWQWTYFKAIYKSTNGAVIEDENYMTDPDVLVGRKKITGPDGKVLMYMDITLKAITPRTFDLLASGLLKKDAGKAARATGLPHRTRLTREILPSAPGP